MLYVFFYRLSRSFHFNLWHQGHELKRKKQAAVTYSTDRENEVSMMLMISQAAVCFGIRTAK